MRSRLYALALACAIAAGGCHAPASPEMTIPLAPPLADSTAVMQLAFDWWAAYANRDSSYFTRVLTDDFVSRQAQVQTGQDYYRDEFIRRYVGGMPCGELTYQVQLASVRQFDSIAVVTTYNRLWGGKPSRQPVQGQLESILTLIAVWRAGTWRIMEARPFEFQIGPEVWSWPDTTLLIGPGYTTNPRTQVRSAGRPCPPPPRPPAPPPQPSLPEPGVSLRLRVIDSATSLPIRRAYATELLDLQGGGKLVRGAPGDTLGQLVFDSVRTWPVRITCRTTKRFEGAAVAELDSATLVSADGRPWVVRGNGAQCDQRPLLVQRGRWRGRYSAGFELSEFRWCGDTSRSIWVTMKRNTVTARGVKWPPLSSKYVRSAFITVIGTMRGPDRYGHMGGATHELEVDSILSVRAVGPRDCR